MVEPDTAAIRARTLANFRAHAPIDMAAMDVAVLCDEIDRLRADYAAVVAERDAQRSLVKKLAEGSLETARLLTTAEAANAVLDGALVDAVMERDDLRRQLDAVIALCDHQDGIGAYLVMVKKVLAAATQPAAEPTADGREWLNAAADKADALLAELPPWAAVRETGGDR